MCLRAEGDLTFAIALNDEAPVAVATGLAIKPSAARSGLAFLREQKEVFITDHQLAIVEDLKPDLVSDEAKPPLLVVLHRP